MAGLAPTLGAISPDSLHTLLELPLMRIVVATGAVQVAPVVDNGGLGFELRRFLVAVDARRSAVRTQQRKFRLRVIES